MTPHHDRVHVRCRRASLPVHENITERWTPVAKSFTFIGRKHLRRGVLCFFGNEYFHIAARSYVAISSRGMHTKAAGRRWMWVGSHALPLQRSRGVSAFLYKDRQQRAGDAREWSEGFVAGVREGCGEREADGRPRAAVSVRLPCRFTRVRVTGRCRWEDGPTRQAVEPVALSYNQKYITPRFLYNFKVLLLRVDKLSTVARHKTRYLLCHHT